MAAAVSFDFKVPLVGITRDPKRFGPCSPADPRSISQGWQYLARYIHYEPGAGLNFHCVLVSDQGKFRLAVYEGDRINASGLDDLPADAKINSAAKVVDMTAEEAAAVYRAWTRVLLRSKYGSGASGIAARNYFYISAFGSDVGYMNADSVYSIPDSDTGDIVEVGRLLRKYAITEENGLRTELGAKILSMCDKINRRQP